VSGPTATTDPAGALAGLRSSVAAGNPDLYRHLALYLQVLRCVLPERVEQACFHLATQVHSQRYLQLPARQRRELHRLLRERVSRCCSLLTVEQLVALARQLEQEKQQQQQRRQQELLQRLLQQGDRQESLSETADTPPPDPLPPGSVRLDLTTPFDHPGLSWGQAQPPNGGMTDAASANGERSHSADSAQTEDDASQDSEDDGTNPETDSDSAGDGSSSDGSSSAGTDADIHPQDEVDEAELMAALIEGLLEAGALDGGAADPEGEGGQVDSDVAGFSGAASLPPGPGRQPPRQEGAMSGRGAAAVLLGGADAEAEGLVLESGLHPAGQSSSDVGSPWEQPGLPQDPLLLLRWLDGLEAALTRRLRHLSHAINVDLLRLGLTRGLLPVSLLEAVLQGQIETLASPANVLRVQLPFGLQPGAPPLQAIAILLRPVDLEMEEPRLRTCRRRIHQHRQQVRKMAQTYRRLQRRLQAHEAERLWLQDIRASRKTGT
jgi:hypothetical protein